MAVTELGYIGLGVSDLAAWKTFCSDVIGAEVVADSSENSFTVRFDYWFWRILVEENPSDDLEFVGWRVAGEDELDVMRQRLTQAGIPFQDGTTEQIKARGVLGLITLRDPGGMPTEIFFGPRIEPGVPFHPGRRRHGPFVTGKGGLGHVVTSLPDTAKGREFYTRILGMKGSIEYYITRPGIDAEPLYFMSCNPRQHSFAFGNLNMGKRMAHLMIETSCIEDVGLTRDIVKQRGIKIRSDIGQHNNDRALTFYCTTPSGWTWETGWAVVEPAGQAEWGLNGIWGHDRG